MSRALIKYLQWSILALIELMSRSAESFFFSAVFITWIPRKSRRLVGQRESALQTRLPRRSYSMKGVVFRAGIIPWVGLALPAKRGTSPGRGECPCIDIEWFVKMVL
jgi:hypothetical protein